MLFTSPRLSLDIYLYMHFLRRACDFTLHNKPELFPRIQSFACFINLEPYEQVGSFDSQEDKGAVVAARRKGSDIAWVSLIIKQLQRGSWSQSKIGTPSFWAAERKELFSLMDTMIIKKCLGMSRR